MEKQSTIAKEVTLEGVGLHTGNMTRMVFRPAPAGSGITFVRVDLPGKPAIRASCSNVIGAIRGTTIGNDPARVHTVEHLLASCSMLGIDNMEIEITNNEPPIMDGSAKPFAELLLQAGTTEQDAPRTYFVPKGTVTYEVNGTKIVAEPAEELIIDCTISYKHPFLSRQQATFTLTRETFLKEIAPARTFCFDYEIEALKSKGLAKGGDLANAIVVGLAGIHNPGKLLRFPDEFVRHKILDLVGDLYLIGMPLKARVTALRCGHNHNISFAKELMKQA